MIAEILEPFVGTTLNYKIDYQISKIEKGFAKELFNSSGGTLNDMYRSMSLVASLNDRVKSPYIEFILSSPVGENLSDEKFLEVAKEYMEKMGYGDSCYTITKNNDKDHLHVHILATTININGLRISDSYSKIRSGKIMRELELKHGLEIMEKGKSSHNKTLGESQYRQYFFDTALHKALRSLNAKDRVNKIIGQSDTYKNINPDMEKTYTNTEWKIMLGDDTYEKLLEVLSKGKFFNPLFKDELLSAMDHLYLECGNVKEFRERLEKDGYYMRLITNRGRSYYIYGILDRSFYLKDMSLPKRYRFGEMSFDGQHMKSDEQKHYLYNHIFALLSKSSNYEDFKKLLSQNNIQIIEIVNTKGVYGLKFSLSNIEEPESFKSTDISRRLSYKNILMHFNGHRTDIEPVVINYIGNTEKWDKDIKYMRPLPLYMVAGMLLNSGTDNKELDENDEFNKKKKKRKKKRRNRDNGLSL